MSNFNERFAELIEEKPGSDIDIARELGVSRQTISAWKLGTRSPKRPAIVAVAAHFGVSVAWLMGMTDDKKFDDESSFHPTPANIVPIKRFKFPILGHIAAGVPIMAEQEFDTYADVGEDLKADFGLIVDGDSMEPTIHRGDLVFIRQQDDVEDGEIAAVIIDDSATLKHVYHIPGGVQLISENPKYKPQIYTSGNSDYLAILGKAISFKRIL